MSKQFIFYLTEEEIKALDALCHAGKTMGDQGSNFFKKFEPQIESVLQKFEAWKKANQ